MKNRYILTLDIGGTNPRLAIVEVIDENNFKIIEKKLISNEEISIINPINNFLKEIADKNITTNTCVIGVAGPVENNSCLNPTNSKLSINSIEIKEKTMLENILVINDFNAIGHAISKIEIEKGLNSGELVQIKSGIINDFGNRGIIGPGTGLGVSYLIKDENKFIISSSEGGHCSICEINSKLGLFDFLKRKLNIKQIGVEALVSGIGIRDIFDFFSSKNKDNRDLEILKSFDNLKLDTAKLIAESKSKNAKKTMDLFVKYLAIATSNVALFGLSTGGIFIAGGICNKNLNLFEDKIFVEYFENNSKQFELLKKIPIYIVVDYDISFYGCARAGILKFY